MLQLLELLLFLTFHSLFSFLVAFFGRFLDRADRWLIPSLFGVAVGLKRHFRGVWDWVFPCLEEESETCAREGWKEREITLTRWEVGTLGSRVLLG